MAAPVTTNFDSKDMSRIITKTVRGIVRHYKVPRRKHGPYPGMLKDPTDLKEHEIRNLQDMIRDFPDGEEIEIVVSSKGKSQCAHGFVWMLTKPNIYERVPKEEWLKTFPKVAEA